MLLSDLNQTIRIYFETKRVIASYGYALPEVKVSLFRFLLYEIFSRKPLFYIRNKDGKLIKTPVALQRKLRKLSSRFIAYLRLLAYDDGVEIYNLTRREVYGQLERCMTGFIVGLSNGFPINVDEFQIEFEQVSKAIQNVFAHNKAARQEIFFLFENGNFLRRVFQEKVTLNLQDILYDTGDKDFDDMFNVTIVASLELGKTLKHLYEVLLADLYTEQELKWHREFIIEALVKSGYAQANTVRQRTINKITWSEYMEIAFGKSNSLLDIINCFRGVINKELFFQQTFNKARFCAQFYLDDMQDFDKDARQGILGVLHIFLLEQGRLAEQLLPYVREYELRSQQLIMVLKKILSTSRILDARYQGVFIYRNPIVSAKRNDVDNILFEADNTDNIIREIFVNSEDELEMPLTELLSLRIKTYEMFCEYWNAHEFTACAKLMYKTSVPSLMIRNFIKFLRPRKDIIKFSSPRLGWYYYLIFTAYHDLFYFRVRKWLHSFLDSDFRLRYLLERNVS